MRIMELVRVYEEMFELSDKGAQAAGYRRPLHINSKVYSCVILQRNNKTSDVYRTDKKMTTY